MKATGTQQPVQTASQAGAAACLVGPLVQMFLPTARRLLKKEPQNASSV